MLPILFKLGPITIYSFGVFLFLMVLLMSFFIWREARRKGLSEEKILDVLALSIIVAIITGRLSFVYFNWSIFGVDLSRIILVTKYPGFFYQGGTLAAFLTVAISSFSFGLDWLLVADVFSLTTLGVMSLGYFGCYLDGCYPNSGVILGLVGGAVGLGLVLNLVAYRLTHSSALLEFSRRHGLFFLAHLIFILVSFLILAGQTFDRIWTVAYFISLSVVVVVFITRYFGLVRYFFVQIYGAVSAKRIKSGQ